MQGPSRSSTQGGHPARDAQTVGLEMFVFPALFQKAVQAVKLTGDGLREVEPGDV